MGRQVLALALGGALAFITGCSSGDDVYIKTGSTKSAATCELAAGEDVCARNWDDLEPERKPNALTFLDAAASLAAHTQSSLAVLDQACTEILVSIGAPTPTPPADASLAERAEVICSAASAAITERKHATFQLEEAPRTCTPVPLPSCLPAGERRRLCDAPEIELVPIGAAADSDHQLASSIRNGIARIIGVMRGFEEVAALQREVVAVVGTGNLGIPECLMRTATALLSNSANDIEVAARLASAVGRSLGQ
jgi:hypothetical protein